MTENQRTETCPGGMCQQPDRHDDPGPGGDCRRTGPALDTKRRTKAATESVTPGNRKPASL